MNFKHVILTALAVLALASCAKVESTVLVPQPTPESRDVALNFGIYVPQTKAGAAGAIDNTTLKTTGFGVLAYVKSGVYDGSGTPNFMYNQEVTCSGGYWTYSPVKYWPNQLDDNGINGVPQAAQQVSFFAYAPYVETPGGTAGIVALSDAEATGDPTITYKVSADLDQNVDLVWGTANGSDWTNAAGETKTLTEGLPILDIKKPSVDTRVAFKFYHALAQLNLTAQGSYNIVGAGGMAQDGVKITIGEVKLTVPDQYNMGILNLNNTSAKTPLWDLTTPGTSEVDLDLTVSGTKLNAAVLDEGAKTAAAQSATGVTAIEGPVLADGKYFTLLPRVASTTVTVRVTYYVTTDDPKLDGGYSRVKNVIEKSIVFSQGFQAGKKYNIKMVLGLTSVTLSAEVADWETGDTIATYLPKNE